MGLIAEVDPLLSSFGWFLVIAVPLVLFCYVCFMALMWVMRPTFNQARNEFGRDHGHITQFKADSLTEKQARRIYGDAETDRFLKHGDYNEHLRRITYDPMYDDELD